MSRKSWRVIATIDFAKWMDAIDFLKVMKDIDTEEPCKAHFELVEGSDSSEQSVIEDES